MVKRSKKKRINPNEYVGLMMDNSEMDRVLHVLFDNGIFRYSSKKQSEVDKFENRVKKHLSIKYALGLNNGTSALKVALISLGVQQGDRVLISAYTFIATPASVISLKATPVPIDIDLKTGMELVSLENELKKGCKALILVHLQGRTFNINSVLEMAKKYNVPVIEDACQAFSSTYKGKYAGTFADIGVFSFQQYKQMSSGEGGMLVTNNKKYYQKAKIYSDHGVVREKMSWDVSNAMIGDNLRMNNLQAAILIPQLKRLNDAIRLQKYNREYILNRLKTPLKTIIQSSDPNGDTGMNIFFMAKSAEIADEIIRHSSKKKIEFRRLWDRPYYKHGVFNKYKFTPKDVGAEYCVLAESISRRLLSVSLSPILTPKELNKISNEILALVSMNYIN